MGNQQSTGLFWTGLEAKALGEPDDSSRVLRFIASDESIDSHGDIVEQDWDFARFDKNPVILYHHNKAADSFFGGDLKLEETLPVGRAVGRGISFDQEVGKHLWIDVEFATAELSEFADKVYRFVKAGYLRAGSVGFYPHTVTSETVNDREVYRLKNNELMEFSIVPMGSNKNAVRLSIEDKEAHRALLRSLAESQAAPAAPKKENHMPEPVVEKTAVEAPVTLGADTERLKLVELEAAGLREKLALREKADAERDVDAIVAKKIVPAQREDFLALRTLSADLFERITESLPELAVTKNVVEPEPIIETKSTDAESAGQAAARLLRPATEN